MTTLNASSVRRIAVLGAGQMGRGIAQVAAAAGLAVDLCDAKRELADGARATVAGTLKKLVEKGKMPAADANALVGRIRVVASPSELGEVDMAVEAATENLDVKVALLRRGRRQDAPRRHLGLEHLEHQHHAARRPDVATRPRDRHALHEPGAADEAGRAGARRADQRRDTYGMIKELSEALGKTVITSKDQPGFVVNRMLVPFLNEACFALQEGLGTPEDIDQGAKLGLNHPMGPLELADLIGLDTLLFIAEVLHREFGDDKYRPATLLRNLVAAGWYGKKVGRAVLSVRRGSHRHRGHRADEEKAARWREIVSRYVAEAESAGEDTFKSALYTSAADIAFRYGRTDAPGILETVAQQLDQALRLDKRNRRAAALAELVYAATKDAAASARIQEHVLAEAASKDDRLAAGLRLGRTASKKLGDPERAVRAYQAVLDLAPGQQDALAYLAEAYSSTGEWDHLVALYEDQLRGGGVRPAEEVGVLVQIAMVHWRMRGKPQEAEAYFDRVRRADPAHAGMLAFFRELCTAKGDKNRLATILTDAQRAMKDGEDKRALATEIARLAESQENAQKAIEQYKTILRTDPENADAREALKRLYVQTERPQRARRALPPRPRAHAARGHRRAPRRSCATSRRSIASGRRTRARSSRCCRRSWQLDDKDVDAVRELATIYEALGRWRDLLTTSSAWPSCPPIKAEKADLYRSAARRWLEQFSNVQNAVAAYEACSRSSRRRRGHREAAELYQKRRAWPQLYTLYEKQLAGTSGKARIELLSEMAKLAAERLDRGADAIALQKQILEIDPHAPGVFDALEKQAEREKDFATLAEVLEQRVTAASDDAMRLNVLQKLGTVYSERLKDNAATKRTWLRVLEASPGHAKALRVLRDAYVAESDWDGLEELYASQNDWEGLVEFLTSTADRATPRPRTRSRSRSARRASTKRSSTRANARLARTSACSRCMPKDERAARALVPIYEKEEKWARLPALYEILLGATEDETATVELLKKLAATTGGPLADKAAAVEYARRAYDIASDAETLGCSSRGPAPRISGRASSPPWRPGSRRRRASPTR
jgi:3-hydroxyacyl-CoA dehydrogenase